MNKSDPIFATKHNRNTRNRDLLVATRRTLTKTQHAVTFSGPREWNRLPADIRNSRTLKVFKASLKAYLLESY